jgi:hypothetical protein
MSIETEFQNCYELFEPGVTRNESDWRRIATTCAQFLPGEISLGRFTTVWLLLDPGCQKRDLVNALGIHYNTTYNWLDKYWAHLLIKIGKVYRTDPEAWQKQIIQWINNKAYIPTTRVPVINLNPLTLTDETIDSPLGSVLLLAKLCLENHDFLNKSSSKFTEFSTTYPTIDSMLNRFMQIHNINGQDFLFSLIVYAIKKGWWETIQHWIDHNVTFKNDMDDLLGSLDGLIMYTPK